MFCPNCGSQIDDKAVICPHCGVPVKETKPESESKPKNTVAIVGFILSFFIALAGLICSVIGYQKSKNEGAPYKNLALAGIIIGAINMAFGVILSILNYSAGGYFY